MSLALDNYIVSNRICSASIAVCQVHINVSSIPVGGENFMTGCAANGLDLQFDNTTAGFT
jgi:hypothetical protein